ncbi:MAG: hypothetical protein ABIR98_15320 [Usitatibacter sp.]
MITLFRPVLAAVFALGVAGVHAEQSTVCTITVNSPDEREAFRDLLPADKYRFVELAERGRRDWLGAACHAQVRCDVLVISGHFAGTDFYSSQHGEHLPVEEIERVACGDSCPGLFSELKEVYLFGCDTLKAEPVKSAAAEIVRGLVRAGRAPVEATQLARLLSDRHAESARERMRRAFPGVPVIYGFASLAPYGRVAGPMLRSYLQGASATSVGTGEVSRTLLKLFGPSSMVATEGSQAGDGRADYRAEACRYHDDRVTPAGRLTFMHRLLASDMPEVRMAFDRMEKFFATIGEVERASPGFDDASASLAGDAAARASYLAIVRDTQDPALRVRMIALARNVGWLTPAGERAEVASTIADVLATGTASFSEVEMVCALNGDRSLDGQVPRSGLERAPATAANAAALACLGHPESHARTVRALVSANEDDVRVAQAYLRHRPIADAAELRAVVAGIAAMKPSAAQARALEALARLHVTDSAALESLARLFTRSTSLAVQRAIAEVFIRSGADGSPELAALFRERRVRSGAGEDLIDVLIRRMRS